MTVIPPNTPAKITRNNDIRERLTINFLFLNFRKLVNAKARMNNPSIDPVNLCEYSMRVWNSNGGISSPWHKGQSGHPNPDSVERTNAPSEIWMKAMAKDENIISLEPMLWWTGLSEDLVNNTNPLLCAFFHELILQ